ncbi:MAG TPA: MFS transporter, partial [Longimicrobiales bacterium]|nr:MFS transporter [Longimicrobiales bacterium]
AVRNLRWAVLYLFLFGVSLSVYPVYFPRHLVDLGLPVHLVGVASAASWVAFGLSQPVGARYADRTSRHKPLLVASLLVAAALNLFMALASSLWWVLGAWVLLGFADGLGRPATLSLIASSTPAPHRGHAFGWTNATVTASGVVAPFALAFLVMAHGIAAGLLAVTATIVLAALPPLLIREVPREEPPPQRAPAGAGAGVVGGGAA